jgi:hypothetical protein
MSAGVLLMLWGGVMLLVALAAIGITRGGA